MRDRVNTHRQEGAEEHSQGRSAVTRIFFLVSIFLVGALCLPTTVVQAAGNAKAARKHVESSMVVTGNLDIDRDGTVSAVSLDQEDLTDALSSFVRDAALHWIFEPVRDDEGNALAVRAPMRVRLIARELEGDSVQVAIRSANFSPKYDPEDQSIVRSTEVKPPTYPRDALRARMSANTITAIKVGRDGSVEDVSTRQVNLLALTSEREMPRWRQKFAQASERAMRTWKFRVPTTGPQADAPYWIVAVPTHYRIKMPSGDKSDRPRGNLGKWETYLAGPLHPIPWLNPNDARNLASPDTLGDGGVYMDREDGLKLLTPLDEG